MNLVNSNNDFDQSKFIALLKELGHKVSVYSKNKPYNILCIDGWYALIGVNYKHVMLIPVDDPDNIEYGRFKAFHRISVYFLSPKDETVPYEYNEKRKNDLKGRLRRWINERTNFEESTTRMEEIRAKFSDFKAFFFNEVPKLESIKSMPAFLKCTIYDKEDTISIEDTVDDDFVRRISCFEISVSMANYQVDLSINHFPLISQQGILYTRTIEDAKKEAAQNNERFNQLIEWLEPLTKEVTEMTAHYLQSNLVIEK